MAAKKEIKFSLPVMEHKFSIQSMGEESQINWVGDFKYVRPNLSERTKIDIMRVKLNGDLRTLDEDIKALNEALAHLYFTLKEFPEWWKESDFGGRLYDTNVILDIYESCIKFEKEWREKVHGGKPEGVEVDGENQEPAATVPA